MAVVTGRMSCGKADCLWLPPAATCSGRRNVLPVAVAIVRDRGVPVMKALTWGIDLKHKPTAGLSGLRPVCSGWYGRCINP